MIDPKLQNHYGSNSRIDVFNGTVTSAELVDDPTLKVPGGDNPYWLTVCVKVGRRKHQPRLLCAFAPHCGAARQVEGVSYP